MRVMMDTKRMNGRRKKTEGVVEIQTKANHRRMEELEGPWARAFLLANNSALCFTFPRSGIFPFTRADDAAKHSLDEPATAIVLTLRRTLRNPIGL